MSYCQLLPQTALKRGMAREGSCKVDYTWACSMKGCLLMHDRWLNENWTQFMSGPEQLITEARQKASELHNDKITALLDEAEQQRTAAEAALREFGEQRHALLQTLDTLQSELAVAGRPLQGEVS